eukprot:gene3160-3459_t
MFALRSFRLPSSSSSIRRFLSSEVKKEAGVVKWYDSAKGYGFITVQDNDYFVHHSSIVGIGPKILAAGDAVEFVPDTATEKGNPKAFNVTGPKGQLIQRVHSERSPPSWNKFVSVFTKSFKDHDVLNLRITVPAGASVNVLSNDKKRRTASTRPATPAAPATPAPAATEN